MITHLSIKNYALIESLEVDFSKGFSTITGETGAGKSIVLGALGLVLGKRADMTSLKNKEEKCVIEAYFDISKYNLQEFFEANNLEYHDDTIIRREIMPTEKSRAFVNDSPVNLQELQNLSLYLIDIHSQHQTRELLEETFQLQTIDTIAENKQLLADYQIILKQYKQERNKLNSLIERKDSAQKEQSYNTFLLEELVAAKLKPNEQPDLEAEYESLNNVEIIREVLDKSLNIANEEPFGMLKSLNDIKAGLQKLSTISVEYKSVHDRFNTLGIELQDVFTELTNSSEKLVNDPERLDFVNNRLQLIYNLQKKHQVQTNDELLKIQKELEEKVSGLENLEDEILGLTKSIEQKDLELNQLSDNIFKRRVVAVPVLSEKLIAILKTLGMPNVSFKIEIKHTDEYYVNGKDAISFLFSANKGSDYGLLKKVASGGEISRIKLAIKAILAQYWRLPTLIFDEIDSGVSGEIAMRMGEIMKQMSNDMQIFAITHLPQIASKGDQHFKVSKIVLGNDTKSELNLLSDTERIQEIAQMLSGSELTDSALNHAKTLLS